MAEHLASIYGTEKDKVNCPFYYKIGACRHGDRCSRQHNKPSISQTVMLRRLYDNPSIGEGGQMLPNQDDAQQQFDEFYEDIFDELSKFGEIDEMNVCDNACEHLLGNVYVKYYEEDDAKKALDNLFGRFYAGKPILPEYSPVTDFREASCRQHALSECDRGGFCNFIHLKKPSTRLQRRLFGRVQRHHEEEPDRRSRDRSRDRDKRRHRDRSRDRDTRRDRDRSRSRSRDRDRDRDRGRGRDRGNRDRGGRDRSKERRNRSRERDSKRERDYDRKDGDTVASPPTRGDRDDV